MARARAFRVAWLFGLVFASSAAFATTTVHLDTRELVRSSSDIVVGKVHSTRVLWDESRRHIYTEITLEVAESLKGQSQRLTLRQLGGELDGMRYTVPGSPVFRVGEEALVFAWRDRQGRAQVNGLAQGKFEIRRDPVTQEARVQRGLPGLAVRDARTLRLVRAGQVAPEIPLRRMLDEIRRVLLEDAR